MRMSTVVLLAAVVASIAAICAAAVAETAGTNSRTLRVPADHPTIQAAIDAADDGDTVQVAPGVYGESLRIAGKSVKLLSDFAMSGDKEAVRKTILDGIVTDADGRVRMRDAIILVEASAGPETEIVGFTIRNGDDGISCQADIRIAHNYFTGNDDALDYEGGGGLCEYNRFEKNRDDAVDYDLDCDAVVVNNEMIDNEDDGIEIRLHDYTDKTLELVIRDNVITGNLEDGIQIIDYPGMSNRRIRIEGNVIAGNAMAGIGCMSDATTEEDYRAADIPEPIEVVNNTIVGNEYGITGGDNLVAFNNVIAANKQLGMKQVDAQSVASHNLFWKNGTNFDAESNVRTEHTLEVDPQLDGNYRPAAGSPCVGQGVIEVPGPAGIVKVSLRGKAGTASHLGALDVEAAE
jgi:hypothetical protein